VRQGTVGSLEPVLSDPKLKDKLAQGRATTLAEIRSVVRQSTSQSPTDGPSPVEPIEAVAMRKFATILDLVIQDLGVLELVGSGRGERVRAALAESVVNVPCALG
jgi:hypothetical protein